MSKSSSGTSETGRPAKRKSVDDTPYGGGPGMLIMCPPVFDAVEAIQPDAEQRSVSW